MSNVVKVLIVVLIIAAIVAGVFFCLNKQVKENSQENNSGENTPVEVVDNPEEPDEDVEHVSLEKRIEPYTDFMKNFEDSDSLMDTKPFISSAVLSKKGSKYNLHFIVSSDSVEYSEEEMEAIKEQLKTKDTAVLDDKYTFYKDKATLLAANDWTDAEKELINSNYIDTENNLFTFKLDGSDYDSLGCYYYTIGVNSGKTYKVYGMNVAGASYYSLSEKLLNEFDIDLYKDDKLVIAVEDNGKDYEYTVEEYYKKIENDESIKMNNDNITYVFEYDLGIAHDPYGGLTNAISFYNEKIYINFFFGGV